MVRSYNNWYLNYMYQCLCLFSFVLYISIYIIQNNCSRETIEPMYRYIVRTKIFWIQKIKRLMFVYRHNLNIGIYSIRNQYHLRRLEVIIKVSYTLHTAIIQYVNQFWYKCLTDGFGTHPHTIMSIIFGGLVLRSSFLVSGQALIMGPRRF